MRGLSFILDILHHVLLFENLISLIKIEWIIFEFNAISSARDSSQTSFFEIKIEFLVALVIKSKDLPIDYGQIW